MRVTTSCGAFRRRAVAIGPVRSCISAPVWQDLYAIRGKSQTLGFAVMVGGPSHYLLGPKKRPLVVSAVAIGRMRLQAASSAFVNITSQIA